MGREVIKIVVPGLIVFALWSFVCVRWYVCGIYELCNEDASQSRSTMVNNPDIYRDEPQKEGEPSAPLAFDWSSSEPVTGNTFLHFKDSLQAAFDEHPAAVVEITGLYDPQELNNSQFENLGLARAQQVKDLLLSAGLKRSISISSRPEDLSAGLGEKIIHGVVFDLAPAESVYQDFTIYQTDTKMIIYFPDRNEYPASSEQIRKAVSNLAKQAMAQKRSLLVVGHTDNRGDAMDNKVIGLVRASRVMDLLIAGGMPEAKILAESEGEDDPVVSNATARGRQQNRRVEIIII